MKKPLNYSQKLIIHEADLSPPDIATTALQTKEASVFAGFSRTRAILAVIKTITVCVVTLLLTWHYCQHEGKVAAVLVFASLVTLGFLPSFRRSYLLRFLDSVRTILAGSPAPK